jgi:hypothetical protein
VTYYIVGGKNPDDSDHDMPENMPENMQDMTKNMQNMTRNAAEMLKHFIKIFLSKSTWKINFPQFFVRV